MTVVESAILGLGLLGQQYLGCRREETRQTDQDRSVLQCPLDPVQVVGDGRMIAKQSSQMDNNSHPMHDIATVLGSSLNDRLKDHYCRSFLPAAVRLDNYSSTAHCNTQCFVCSHTRIKMTCVYYATSMLQYALFLVPCLHYTSAC